MTEQDESTALVPFDVPAGVAVSEEVNRTPALEAIYRRHSDSVKEYERGRYALNVKQTIEDAAVDVIVDRAIADRELPGDVLQAMGMSREEADRLLNRRRVRDWRRKHPGSITGNAPGLLPVPSGPANERQAQLAQEQPDVFAAVHAAHDRQTYTDLEALDREPDPEVRDAALASRVNVDQRPMSTILKDAMLTKRTRERDAEHARLADQFADPAYQVECCDFAELPVADGSVDLLFTDPPYEKAWLPRCAEFAQWAARKLKPGGSLLVMVGHWYHHDIAHRIQQAAPELKVRPDIDYKYLVPFNEPGLGIISDYKPVLCFSRGKYRGAAHHNMYEAIKADYDKEHHAWGQGVPWFKAVMEDFGKPGDLVCDPFVGGGTTALAAYSAHRRFIGGGKKPGWGAKAQGRLEETRRLPGPYAEVAFH